MKDMEIKTENRYEYRKTQEKRKQMIAPDLFEFAYVPDWYGHLAELERLALPESWRFRKPSRETKNTETPILERYIHTIFRKQVIDFNSESDPRKADSIFHWENECVCFHTGLYTPQYKGIYGYFERNNFSDSLRDWYFESVDEQLGAANISNYIQEIGYGNENISGDFSTYWMEMCIRDRLLSASPSFNFWMLPSPAATPRLPLLL